MVDIENNKLEVGDEVYYARKKSGSIMCEITKCIITRIEPEEKPSGVVYLGKFVAKMPNQQLLKIKK